MKTPLQPQEQLLLVFSAGAGSLLIFNYGVRGGLLPCLFLLFITRLVVTASHQATLFVEEDHKNFLEIGWTIYSAWLILFFIFLFFLCLAGLIGIVHDPGLLL